MKLSSQLNEKIEQLDPPYKKQKKFWICSICGKNFYWNKNARWFGIVENPIGKEEIEKIICSKKCFLKIDEKDEK